MRHPASNPFSREPYTFVSRFPQVDADELHATRKALDCALVRYQDDEIQADSFVDKTNILYWNFLRNNVQPAEFSIILNLASRHSLTWTNKFIESLVDFDDGTKTFVINTKRLETLIFLQEHCGLQGRDLSDSKSPYIIKNNDVYLLEKRIEEDSFDDERIDEANEFLNRFKDKDTEAINWIKFLVKQKFLNFAVLCKKYHLENSELILWLEQWADQCGVKQKMKEAGSLNLDFIPSDTLNQRTLRNIVRYGLSPHWLRTVSTSASQSVLEDAIQQEIIPDNADFRSALEYHQGQNIIFADRYEHSKFFRAITEQPVIEDDAESHVDEHDNHPWIQTYTTKPEDLHTLRQLSEVLSLERLKFYHDYHRLPALIQQVQEGKLSLAEVEEYDKPLHYKKCFDDTRNDASRFKDFCTNNSPRILPRLLASFSELETSLPLPERIKQMAGYDMYDYRPKPNSVSDDGKSEKVVTFFKLYDNYLQNYFDQVILPIAEERARLYLKLIELQKKNAEQWQLSKNFVGSFDAQIHLVEQKIDIFSGFLEEACYEIKRAEINAIASKEKNSCDDFDTMTAYPGYIKSYCQQIGFDKCWEDVEIQLFSVEIVTSNLKNQEIGIYLDDKERLQCSYIKYVGPCVSECIVTSDLEAKLDAQTTNNLKSQLRENKEKHVSKKQFTSKNEVRAIITAIHEELLDYTAVRPSGIEMKQNSLYRLERDGLNDASDTKNPQKTRSFCYQPVVNSPQNPVRACLGYITGILFTFTRWLVKAPISFIGSLGYCFGASELWMKSMHLNHSIDREYAGVFYATHSQYTLFKTNDKTMDVHEKFKQDLERENIVHVRV